MERGGKRNGEIGYGMCAWACEKKILKREEAEERVLSSPLQLVALGVDVPCICQARVRPRQVGLEQEVEGLHLRAVVAAAAAAVEGDLQTHPRVTRHCWKQGLGKEPVRSRTTQEVIFSMAGNQCGPQGLMATVVHAGPVCLDVQVMAHTASPDQSGGGGGGGCLNLSCPPSRLTSSTRITLAPFRT